MDDDMDAGEHWLVSKRGALGVIGTITGAIIAAIAGLGAAIITSVGGANSDQISLLLQGQTELRQRQNALEIKIHQCEARVDMLARYSRGGRDTDKE